MTLSRRLFTTTANPARKAYPKSFIAHLRTQKLNAFNIGMAFLTLSLSSQMVSYKQKYQASQEDNKVLEGKVRLLESCVKDLGGKIPVYDSGSAENIAVVRESKPVQQIKNGAKLI